MPAGIYPSVGVMFCFVKEIETDPYRPPLALIKIKVKNEKLRVMPKASLREKRKDKSDKSCLLRVVI